MRAVIQRVSQARVTVEGEVVGQIGPGLMVLLGVAERDTPTEAEWLADKLTGLRIFEDEAGKMNRSLIDTNGQMLVVSQFTLLGDCRKGRRPSFIGAARPELAETLYEAFVRRVGATPSASGQPVGVATGRFQTDMKVSLVNDGPVTLVVETPAAG